MGFRVVDGQGLLAVPGQSSEIHLVNAVATRICELMDGRRDEEAIALEIVREYEVDEATARADVAAFIGDLARKGALE